MTGLYVQVKLRDRGVDLAFEVEQGEVLAVLGPNGAGKSSILAMVAGLVNPDEGRIELNGRVLTDSEAGTSVPPHGRSVALLAQEPLLFPHLTVEANVAFAPRSAGLGHRRARALALRWIDEVGATELAKRRPRELSGGQAQRVAVARALAADPQLLLLDEPMSALDVTAAPALRVLLRRVLREAQRTALIVTHDILDALALADRVIVVDGGRIVESGPVHDVLTRPRSGFAARIAGLDLVEGRIEGGVLVASDGTTVSGAAESEVDVDASGVAVFAPSSVGIHVHTPEGSPRNTFRVIVSEMETRGNVIRVRGATESGLELSADVTAAAVAELDLVPGASVYFAVKATEVGLHRAH
ncbi:sulfate/molybdate ABC transporter ATP-binding protein [Rhodococcus sp. NPDC058521]|uniref:sulfate/molybdate ABC transporter ATP-binding protein n=1 Tax=Rhodococcus sp. NPDC058521 TaxID=3346536 RepID=UPI0036584E3B